MNCAHRDPLSHAALAHLVCEYGAGASYRSLAQRYGVASVECIRGILGGVKPAGCSGHCLSQVNADLGRPPAVYAEAR